MCARVARCEWRCVVVEILKSFEQVAGRFSPVVLIAPGLALVVLGLLAWLGGICLRRVVPALVGVGAGALVGFFVGRQSAPVYALAAGAGAAFGAFLPRAFVAVLLVVLGVAAAFVVVARTHLLEEQETLFGVPESGQAEERFTVQQSLDAVRAYAIDVKDRAGAACRKLTPVDGAIVVAVGLGLSVLGVVFGRLAGALTCSTLGAALIFAGLILLLMFKGSTPVARIEQQGAFYGLVLVGMAAFGTLEQLFLCRPPVREPKAKAGKSQPEQQETKRGWRNR